MPIFLHIKVIQTRGSSCQFPVHLFRRGMRKKTRGRGESCSPEFNNVERKIPPPHFSRIVTLPTKKICSQVFKKIPTPPTCRPTIFSLFFSFFGTNKTTTCVREISFLFIFLSGKTGCLSEAIFRRCAVTSSSFPPFSLLPFSSGRGRKDQKRRNCVLLRGGWR